MDMKMQAFLDKVKDMADKTGKVSRHAAGVAGQKGERPCHWRPASTCRFSI